MKGSHITPHATVMLAVFRSLEIGLFYHIFLNALFLFYVIIVNIT